MILPILIEARDGIIVNALHITHIQPSGALDCMLYMAGPPHYSMNGQWSAGGAGNLTGYTNQTTVYGGCSAQDFMAKVNNALALVNMMEKSLGS